VGNSCGEGLERLAGNGGAAGRQGSAGSTSTAGVFGRVANDNGNGCQPWGEGSQAMGHGQAAGADRGAGGVEHTMQLGWQRGGSDPTRKRQ
jgi:hypothetical protein